MFCTRLVIIILLSFPVSLYSIGFINEYKANKAYQKGEYNIAQKLWENNILNNPEDANTIFNLGDNFYKKKNFAEAKNYFERVVNSKMVEPEKKEQAYFNLANSLVQLNDLENAIKSYEKVLQINQDNKRAKKNIEILKKLLEQKNKNKDQDNKNKQNQDKKNKEDNNKKEKKKEKNEKQNKQDGNSNNKDNKDQKSDQNSKKNEHENQNNKNNEQPDIDQKKQKDSQKDTKEDQKSDESNNQDKLKDESNNGKNNINKVQNEKLSSRDKEILKYLEELDKDINKKITKFKLNQKNNYDQEQNNW